MKILSQRDQFKVFSISDEITPDEQQSLKRFHTWGYDQIHEKIRGRGNRYGGDSDWEEDPPYEMGDKEITKHVNNLDSAIDKSPRLNSKKILHRGIGDSADEIFGKPGENIGRVITDKGYGCATEDPEEAEGYSAEYTKGEDNVKGAFVHIHADPGTKVLHNEGYREDEIEPGHDVSYTFPRNQRYKVLSDKVQTRQHSYGEQHERHIHLKALKPGEDTNLEHFSMRS